MTDFVLDCSTTMGWCFEDESSDYAVHVLKALASAKAIVPGIWPLEVANVLIVGERKRRLTAVDSSRFVSLLQELPITVHPEPPSRVFNEVLGIAREAGLSSYDASYLDLSLQRNMPLSTCDKRMSSAAVGLGIPLFANAEAD